MNQEKAKNALQKMWTFLSEIDNKEVVEEVAVKAELSEEVVEETVIEDTVVEAAVEDAEVIAEPVEAELSAEPSYVTKEDFDKFTTELSATLKETIESLNKENVELSKEVTELSAQPSAEAIVHSPESEAAQSKGFQYGTKRPRGTQDLVFEKLNKFN